MDGHPKALEGAVLKLEHARSIFDDLRKQVADLHETGELAWRPTSRRYDEVSGEVQFLVEGLPEVPKEWSLLLGDIVHNLRCVLDHLWWQLASIELGRPPSKREASSIQFPICLNEDAWEGHRFLKHVSVEAAERARRLQPFMLDDPSESLLKLLADLSNHDKHREVSFAFLANLGGGFNTPSEQDCVDCKIPYRLGDDGEKVWDLEMNWGRGLHGPLHEGEVILGIKVEKTGPSPDIKNVPVRFRADVAITDEGLPLVSVVDDLGTAVAATLREIGGLVELD